MCVDAFHDADLQPGNCFDTQQAPRLGLHATQLHATHACCRCVYTASSIRGWCRRSTSDAAATCCRICSLAAALTHSKVLVPAVFTLCMLLQVHLQPQQLRALRKQRPDLGHGGPHSVRLRDVSAPAAGGGGPAGPAAPEGPGCCQGSQGGVEHSFGVLKQTWQQMMIPGGVASTPGET